jgi:hypothetical protein
MNQGPRARNQPAAPCWAFNLYCQLPFGKLHSGTPEIRQLGEAGWIVHFEGTPEQLQWLTVIKNYIALATDDPTAYLDAWQSVDSDEGVPLAVARKAFGGDPKDIIEELNKVLVA